MTKQTTPTSSYKEVRIGKTIYRVTSFFREKRTWERRWNSWQSDAPCRKPFQLPAVPNNRKPRGLPFSPVGSVGASNRLWRLEVATGDPHHCAAVDSPVRYSCRVKPAEPFCRTRYGF